jgi:hypothetical protein
MQGCACVPIWGSCLVLSILIFITKEFEELDDFTKNEAWFGIKLLVDANATSYMKQMADDSYAKAISNVLKN